MSLNYQHEFDETQHVSILVLKTRCRKLMFVKLKEEAALGLEIFLEDLQGGLKAEIFGLVGGMGYTL